RIRKSAPGHEAAAVSMHIRAPKDFWSGIMFLAFAATAMLAARDYSLGSAGKMGPGYFPMMLGAALALIGIVLVVRSLVLTGEAVDHVQIVPLGIITIGVVLFGVMLEPLGLIAALVTVTLIAAYAGRESRPLEAAALAAV